VKVIYTPEARAEFDAAADWYGSRSIKAGDEFITEIEAIEARISESPAQFPVWEIDPNFRKAVLPETFPFFVYFEEVDPGTILIMAVSHGHREPGYWLRRVR
jgi:toxin ParE1/3/4